MNCPAGTEKPRSWKATNDTTNTLGARHGLVAENLPLDGSGERRKLPCLDETEELLAGNVGACPVRHCCGRVSGGLEPQEAVALQMRKSSESGMRVREEEDDGKVKSWTYAGHTVLKGQARPLAFDTGPAVSAELSPTRARALVKQPPTRATPRSPQNTDLQRLRALMMERSCPSRQLKCPRPLLRPHLPRRPRLPRRSVPKL
jgi:hypothetical protein